MADHQGLPSLPNTVQRMRPPDTGGDQPRAGGGIICTEWTPLREPRGPLIGHCALYVVRLKLRLFSCAVFQRGGDLQVALPARNAARPGEPPDWRPCLAWDRAVDRAAFEAAAVSALTQFAPDLLNGGRYDR